MVFFLTCASICKVFLEEFLVLSHIHPIPLWDELKSKHIQVLWFPTMGRFPPWREIFYPITGSCSKTHFFIFWSYRSIYFIKKRRKTKFEINKHQLFYGGTGVRKGTLNLLETLKRMKLEVNELVGMLSIKELTTNFRFIDEYKQLHRAYARI